MCHVIDYEHRLEADSPTAPVANLLFQKLQMVQINEDIQDTISLLCKLEIGKTDNNEVNSEYVAKILSNDQGLSHTVSLNLPKIKEFLDRYQLSAEDKKTLIERSDKLYSTIGATQVISVQDESKSRSVEEMV